MVQICPATVADLQMLTELENQLFPSDRISRRQFRYLLTKAHGLTVKIEQDGILVGYMVLLQRHSCKNLRIYAIGISPTAQNQGFARRLLACAKETAINNNLSHLTLEVCEHNTAAIQLYTAAGFSRYGKKTTYYEDGCTALLLRKNLLDEDITP